MVDAHHAERAHAIATAQMAAAEAGDIETLKSFYDPDATFWSNMTGQTKTLDEQFSQVAAMRGRASNIRYLDIRVTPFHDGFVQQHRAVGDLADGRSLDVHALFVCRMRDGKIVSREEYLDSAQVAAVRG